jgi:hypothetical protein
VEALLARLPDASPLHQREYAIPKGAKPGFLPTLDDLIHDFASSHVKTRSPWTEAGNRPRRYVYDGRLFELSVAESRHLGPVRFGDRSFPDVIRGEFVITNMGGERTRLQIDFPASGPLQGIPVHVSFRPRWWLSIDLVLDDEPPRPS